MKVGSPNNIPNKQQPKINQAQKRNNRIIRNTAVTAGTGAAIGAGVIRPAINKGAKAFEQSQIKNIKLMQESVKKASKNAGGPKKLVNAGIEFYKKISSPKAIKNLEKNLNSEDLTKTVNEMKSPDMVKNTVKYTKKFAKDISKKSLVPSIALGIAGTFVAASSINNTGKFVKAVADKISGKNNNKTQ